MMNKTMVAPPDSLSRAERSERIALALVVAFGVLLMLVASRVFGDEPPFSARRTDRFSAVLGRHASVRIDNISGDIVAAPGKDFAVVVTTTVFAPTQKRADELLAKTTIAQTNDDEGFGLETLWPNSRSWRDDRGRRRTSARIEDSRINARYEVTLPAGVTAIFKTVNGQVDAKNVDGELDVSSVNGNVRIAGTRRSFQARTVNGRIEAAAAQLPPGVSVECRTVNGGVTLTLPKDAKFDLTASAMSGAIASTFPLPVQVDTETPPTAKELAKERAKDKQRESHSPRRIVVRDADEGDVVVDLRDVEREIERSMREVEVEVRRAMVEVDRATRQTRLLTLLPGREYTGSVGQGGASVHISTLNGAINVIAAGTNEADAKQLVSPRRVFKSITVPPMRVLVAPRVEGVPPAPALAPVPAVSSQPALAPAPAAPAHPRPAPMPRPALAARAASEDESDESIVLGVVSGDFLSTTAGASYQIGKVSGRVRILTHGGEIHIESAGAGADLKTYGGDIQIGSVGSEFKALTMAGDVRAGAVGGSASAETSGGDIHIDSVKGSLEAHTAGGDVIVPSVGGGAEVETGGGVVRLGFSSRQASIAIRNAGGDVILTLPGDFHGDFELSVSGASPDETAIRSDFPEISVTKRSGSQQASGSVNGGGPKVVVKTTSGTIRIRKG